MNRRGLPVGRNQRFQQSSAGSQHACSVARLQRDVIGETRRTLLQFEHLRQVDGPVVRVVDAYARVRSVSGRMFTLFIFISFRLNVPHKINYFKDSISYYSHFLHISYFYWAGIDILIFFNFSVK